MNTEELKKLAEAATPGPWAYSNDSKDFPVNGYVTVRDCIYSVCVLPYEGIRADDRVTANGAFIAAANPTTILALIEQHEAVNSELLATRDDNHSMMLEIEGLRKVRDELLAALELFMDRVDEPPKSNCSCHLSPPCNDCVEYSGLREAFSDAHDAIAKAEG